MMGVIKIEVSETLFSKIMDRTAAVKFAYQHDQVTLNQLCLSCYVQGAMDYRKAQKNEDKGEDDE